MTCDSTAGLITAGDYLMFVGGPQLSVWPAGPRRRATRAACHEAVWGLGVPGGPCAGRQACSVHTAVHVVVTVGAGSACC